MPGSVGRPRISSELRETIVRFAGENIRWGYNRLVGELLKLLSYPPLIWSVGGWAEEHISTLQVEEEEAGYALSRKRCRVRVTPTGAYVGRNSKAICHDMPDISATWAKNLATGRTMTPITRAEAPPYSRTQNHVPR